MDTVFLLRPEARSRFLRTAARALGCEYICLWSPLYHPSSKYPSIPLSFRDQLISFLTVLGIYLTRVISNQLLHLHGWMAPRGRQQRSAELLVGKPLQKALRRLLEVSLQHPMQVFCLMPFIANMHTNVERVFSEDFIRQSHLEQEFIHQTLLEELFPPPDSSSSSSLRSFSVESPECSSLLLANTSTVAPHQIPMRVYDRHRTVPFPSTAVDDAAIARAMLAVISSNSSSAADRSWSGRRVGAFKTYVTPAFAPRSDPTPRSHGQKMIKMLINLLRKMNGMRFEGRTQDAGPTSNQLHHMISERKRREKLNESFDALRMLLPPASKVHYPPAHHPCSHPFF
ncbi:hypothetical protein BHE74_00046752 [Ensete ventricosum]|nr:hypothetical protein BHE74_00046752 [Ensete ventricosum]